MQWSDDSSPQAEVGLLPRPLSVFDLLLATLIVAVHLAHLPLAVDHPRSAVIDFVPLVPSLIAVWIQSRFRLGTLHATLMHYVVCVVWAFLYGYGFCLALNARERATPTHGRMLEPISWASDWMREMCVFALFTSVIYAGFSWLALRVPRFKMAVAAGGRAAANRGMENDP